MKRIKMPELVQGICEGCGIMDEYLRDQYGGLNAPCRNCDPDSDPSEIIIVWEA